RYPRLADERPDASREGCQHRGEIVVLLALPRPLRGRRECRQSNPGVAPEYRGHLRLIAGTPFWVLPATPARQRRTWTSAPCRLHSSPLALPHADGSFAGAAGLQLLPARHSLIEEFREVRPVRIVAFGLLREQICARLGLSESGIGRNDRVGGK